MKQKINFEGNDNMDSERLSISSDYELVIPVIDTAASNNVHSLTLMLVI